MAAALFTLFAPVNRMISVMAACFRIAYAGVYLVAITQLVIALQLLADPAQALRAIDDYDTIWEVGLILFGVHLLLIGFLAYRSGFVPRSSASCWRSPDSATSPTASEPSDPGYSISIGAFTFVGEVALIFWLLINGSRHTSTAPTPTTTTVSSIRTPRSPPRWDSPPPVGHARHQGTSHDPQTDRHAADYRRRPDQRRLHRPRHGLQLPRRPPEPVADILAAFRASQTAVFAWFVVLAFAAALLAPVAVGVGRLSSHRAMRFAVPVGIAAAVVQVIGCARWPLLVPGWPPTRPAREPPSPRPPATRSSSPTGSSGTRRRDLRLPAHRRLDGAGPGRARAGIAGRCSPRSAAPPRC